MNRRLRWLFLAVGAGEIFTGLLLLGAPDWTLERLGIAVLPAEPIYLRFVGAFVTSVGISYLWGFLPAARAAAERQRTVLAVTALQRITVALFLAVSVSLSALSPPWTAVALYDATVAVFQAGVCRRTRRAKAGAAPLSALREVP